MGDGLKRVAKLCGGMTVISGGKATHYTATGRVSKAKKHKQPNSWVVHHEKEFLAYIGHTNVTNLEYFDIPENEVEWKGRGPGMIPWSSYIRHKLVIHADFAYPTITEMFENIVKETTQLIPYLNR